MLSLHLARVRKQRAKRKPEVPSQCCQDNGIECAEKPGCIEKRVGKEDDDRNRCKQYQSKGRGAKETQRTSRCDVGEREQGELNPVLPKAS